jgi:hypothetical protein
MWESTPRRYPHGLDLRIINVDEHPFIAIIAIWDWLAKSWEYIDYFLLDNFSKYT